MARNDGRGCQGLGKALQKATEDGAFLLWVRFFSVGESKMKKSRWDPGFWNKRTDSERDEKSSP